MEAAAAAAATGEGGAAPAGQDGETKTYQARALIQTCSSLAHSETNGK